MQPNQKKMCPLRRMQVRGRPTTQANRNFCLLASQECFHGFSFTFLPFSSLPHTSSPDGLHHGAWKLRARGRFAPNSLTLGLVQKQSPGSPGGPLILALRNANPLQGEAPGLCGQGPCSPQPKSTACCAEEHRSGASPVNVVELRPLQGPPMRYALLSRFSRV